MLAPAGSELLVTEENSQTRVVERTVDYLGSPVKPVPSDGNPSMGSTKDPDQHSLD